MGWFLEEVSGHEGWIAAYVEREPIGAGLYRELGYPDRRRERVPRLAVACDCGWRSPQLVAPPGVWWAPSNVEHVPEGFETAARALWRLHVQAVRRVRVSPAGIVAVELLEGLEGVLP